MSTGKVWLVGAGPGDIGLFTVKGMEVLNNADVVVYDSLVGMSILSKIPADVEAVNVGKRASNHTMPQSEINSLLVRKAKEGHKVVRLKGGDPFLFGRGGEEVELLQKENIPFEIVPALFVKVTARIRRKAPGPVNSKVRYSPVSLCVFPAPAEAL